MQVKIEHYPIPLQTDFSLQMYIASKILCVLNLGEVATLCVAVPEDKFPEEPVENKYEKRDFELIASGQCFERRKRSYSELAVSGHPEEKFDKKYIGSFALSGGARVYHLFENLK